MNVIETIKQVLTDYPKISDLISGEVHIDFTEEGDHIYGLSSMGDNKLSEDVLGNQTRINNMVLYVTNQSMEDYERMNNSSFLLELGYYLETIKGNEITAQIDDNEFPGHIRSISVANGMAWSRSEDNTYLTYQIQIKVAYTIESEE